MFATLPLQFGIPGGPELLVILLIAVLLFGANKIPKLARSTGEALGEFQKGREEVEQELQEMREGASAGPEEPGSTTRETVTNPDAGSTTGSGGSAESGASTGAETTSEIEQAETETETEET